ncbi:prolyl hydroxylase family protein [Roseateles chitinivorans]|nr:2OG-Fe(II) oxygenase [Roseateles chitinivorans]
MQLIAHTDRVFSIPCFLSADECSQLIELAETSGFESANVRTAEGQVAMPKIRNNERAMFEDRSWVATLWERLSRAALPTVDGQVAVGLPKDLRFYKYLSGQRFKMHKDGPWKEGSLASRLTFLVYLNDGFVGGETAFREFNVVPATGTALLFIHETWHEGASVTEGIKYVLRSDVLYSHGVGALQV